MQRYMCVFMCQCVCVSSVKSSMSQSFVGETRPVSRFKALFRIQGATADLWTELEPDQVHDLSKTCYGALWILRVCVLHQRSEVHLKADQVTQYMVETLLVQVSPSSRRGSEKKLKNWMGNEGSEMW